jgi:predicted DsbA family dithiol-disulfide isomerase
VIDQPADLYVDIVSDVVCPWCVIGYRQLEKAIVALGDSATVAIRWHPFELVPGMAPEGRTITDHVRERYGPAAASGSGARDRITNTGKALGIDFRYSPDSRIYNTHKAHQLLLWAGEHGRQTELKLALFESYFTGQNNVSDAAILLDAVDVAGLDRTIARDVLDNATFAKQVDAEIAYWQDQNITGVPAYIINGKYMVPGAQDSETFGRIFERVLSAQSA